MKKIFCSIITAFFLLTGGFAQTVVVGGADPATVSGSPYTTLKAAFDNINLVSQAGNFIIITITGTTVESASAVLNESVGPWTSLTIVPVGISAITGNINGPLVDLSGADNVTIDGLNLPLTSLAIDNSNTNTDACTIRFVNDASSNTITHCSLLGASGSTVSTGLGTIYFSSGIVTGNDNNTITQCNISSSASRNPINAIFSMGSSISIDNSNNTISINNISDYFNATAMSSGLNINAFSSGWTITNNALYQTATRTTNTPGIIHHGIFITSGSGYNISNNVIGFAAPNATGTTNMIGLSAGSLGGTFPSAFTAGGTATDTRYYAINCAFTTGGVVSSIQNNTIGGIALFTGNGENLTFGIICGIAVTSGNADIGTVTGNTIGSASGTSSIYVATTTAGGIFSGIYCSTSNTISIQNNTIAGIDVSGTTASAATGFKGIHVSGPGTFTISNNNVGNANANNIRTGYLLTGANLSNTATTPTPATGASTVTGIMTSSSATTLFATANIIRGFQVSGTATSFTGIRNTGNVTTSININNNQIGNATTGAVTFIAATSSTIMGITNNFTASTCTINLNNNSFDGFAAVTSGPVSILSNFANTSVAININNNQMGGLISGKLVTFSGAQSSNFFGIANIGGTTSCTVTMQGNDLLGIVHSITGTSFHQYLYNLPAVASVNMSNNTFTNITANTTSDVTFMTKFGNMGAGASFTCTDNSIVTGYNKTGTGGQVAFLSSQAASVNGSSMTVTGNNFSNVTLTGAATLFPLLLIEGQGSASGPTKTITGNTISNITGGSGPQVMMWLDRSGPITCSSNTISNITGTGDIYGIYFAGSNGAGLHTCASNSISSLISSGAGGNVEGIKVGNSDMTTLNINNNSVSFLSSTGANALIEGIELNGGVTVNVNDNLVNNLSGSGAGFSFAAGIIVFGGTTVNVYKNKIHTISQSGAITGTGPFIDGIYLAGGATVSASNNFISNLSMPNTNSTLAMAGIEIGSVTALSTYNLYYNSIYLNASSVGTNFGSNAVYARTNNLPTTASLTMIDNIFVNTSAPAGAGVTAAYGRTSTILNNYAATSDHNLFYAGTPSANRLIYYDGTNSDATLAAYQSRVSPRDTNSISVLPNFVSATDLHLTTANCWIDNKGTPIAIITDIDNAARDITTPDMGADEFTSVIGTTLAGIVNSAVCEDKTVSVTGTTYITNGCELIAYVLPSGGSAVSGNVNVCVTLDATQQYFNGEPYVQRHHDIEPAVSPATATATITLYYTDAEFVSYNALNPVWPDLPTEAGGGNADPNLANVRVTQFHGIPTGGLPTSTPGNYTGTRILIDPVDTDISWNGLYWAVTFPVNGFSGFYLHTTLHNTPLPVMVNYLNGRKQAGKHLLDWKVTCVSTPRATMTLERSMDARNFSGIYTITADAARCNQPFDHTDANPLNGMNYYRLKIVDADGRITYSTTVALLNASKGFEIISIAPNPVVTDNFKINVSSAQASKINITIYDMQGRLVNRQTVTVIAGFNSLDMNVANLASGTYTIRVGIAEERPAMFRFVKQ